MPSLKKFPHAPNGEKARIYSNLGGLHMLAGKMDEAYQYHQKALSHTRLSTDSSAALIYNNYAGWLFTQGQIDSALHYLLKAKSRLSNEQKSNLDLYYSNLALIYSALGQKELAYQYYHSALDCIGDDAELSFRKAQILVNLGIEYSREHNYKQASKYIKEGIHIAQKVGFGKVEVLGRLHYAQILAQQNNFPQAYNELLHTYTIRDSVLKTENNERTYQLRKDFELKQMQNDLQIAQLNDIKKKLTITILGIITLILITILSILSHQLRKERNENKKINQDLSTNVQNLSSNLEKKNKIITAGSIKSSHKDEILSQTVKELKALKESPKTSIEDWQNTCQSLLKSIQASLIEDRWSEFIFNFENSYPHFFERLGKQHPHLTKGEKRLSALLSTGLNAKEIAEIIHRSPSSVETFIYRLRKKLNIDRDTKTHDYFKNIKDAL